MSSLSALAPNKSVTGLANTNGLLQQQQQQQHAAALHQLMATQNIFNTLTPEQKLIAQQLAAETIQFGLLQNDLPKNIQVILQFFFRFQISILIQI
jgi:hypothetical protein